MNPFFFYFSCACFMRPPSLGTKPYQAHNLSVCCILRAHAQFCRFDKADATADVQWHCNHRSPLWYHFFQLRAHWVRISWSIGSEKSFGLVSPVGVEPFLRERRTPYPLGQALRWNESHCLSAINTTANRHLTLLSEKKTTSLTRAE